MKIFNHAVAAGRNGRSGSRPGRNHDASGKVFFADGHVRLYSTVSRNGEFGKLQHALFVEDDGEYFILADARGNKMQNMNKANQTQNSKLMFRCICDGFPHHGGVLWFVGDFTDETQTKIKLTFDK